MLASSQLPIRAWKFRKTVFQFYQNKAGWLRKKRSTSPLLGEESNHEKNGRNICSPMSKTNGLIERGNRFNAGQQRTRLSIIFLHLHNQRLQTVKL